MKLKILDRHTGTQIFPGPKKTVLSRIMLHHDDTNITGLRDHYMWKCSWKSSVRYIRNKGIWGRLGGFIAFTVSRVLCYNFDVIFNLCTSKPNCPWLISEWTMEKIIFHPQDWVFYDVLHSNTAEDNRQTTTVSRLPNKSRAGRGSHTHCLD